MGYLARIAPVVRLPLLLLLDRSRAHDVRRFRAVDSWGMGCFVQEVFAGRKLARTEELRELGRVPLVRLPAHAGVMQPELR